VNRRPRIDRKKGTWYVNRFQNPAGFEAGIEAGIEKKPLEEHDD
jgi:hypothetical protein